MQVVARWLIGLRWVVFSLLAITLPVGQRYFDFQVVWPVALPALALVFAFNLVAMRRLRAGVSPSPRGVAAGVAFDLVAIAAVLAASGGAANPFSALFFVHVALAASLLPARTTFALSGLAACLFASLFFLPVGACCPNHPAHGAFSNHLYGMWMAFVLSAGLVAYVLSQARRALDARQREIERLREREQENARFAALGTLAAGTAHELATPLGTIAVLAGEITARRASAAAIRDQVTRCREVITKMQAGAQAAAAAHAETSLDVAVERAVDTWRAAHPDVAIVVRAQADGALVPLAASEIEAALCALLDNALHASPGEAPIEVRRAPRRDRIVGERRGSGRGRRASPRRPPRRAVLDDQGARRRHGPRALLGAGDGRAGRWPPRGRRPRAARHSGDASPRRSRWGRRRQAPAPLARGRRVVSGGDATARVASPADGQPPTLLVVDDDAPFRTALGRALEARGFAVTLADSADSGEACAREQVFEYALVDVRMPGASGIDLVGRLRAIDDGTRIVVLTGYGTIANAIQAMRAGAVDYLVKPADPSACERALLGRAILAPAPDPELPSVERVEYEYLPRVLADSEGNVSEAARRLRMHRRSLQRKLGKPPLR